jgi:hypothetical protein
MKHKITVQQVVDHFAGVKELPYQDDRLYLYAETGLCKPFHGATIAALRKRGYRVEFCRNKWGIIPNVYKIYNKTQEAV